MSERLALYRVVMPRAVAGILVDRNGVCVQAAPILRYLIGKGIAAIRAYARTRGWQITQLDGDSPVKTTL